MKAFRAFINTIVVLAASILIGLLAYRGMDGVVPEIAITVAIYVTDGLMILAAFCNVSRCRESPAIMIMTALPVLAFLICGIARLRAIETPALMLLGYDFYLVFWYGYRAIVEFRRENKWR